MRFSTGDYLLYYLAKAFSLFFRVIPVGFALFIARKLGALFSLLSRKRYKVAYANLKAALGNHYKPKELKRILNKTYENIGQGIVDLFILPKMNNRYIERYIRFENFGLAEEVLKKGKGLIFLTAHFGTWEISHAALPHKGLAYKGIAREQKPYHLNELLNYYRQLHGCKIIMKGPAVKEALKTLRSNGIVGMLVDQDAGKKGVFTDLFNRPASWNRGVMEIALKTGATIIPGFAIREKGPFIRFRIFDPIKLRKDINKEDAIKDAFRQYASILEGMIRKYPQQWLWQHRRWKSTPVRKVIILNDKRTGHLRQSEAVLRYLRGVWQERGYRPEDIRAEVIDAEFKNNLCKQALDLGCNLSNIYCQGCMKCLRAGLTKASYDIIMQKYADIIISCGSSTASLNIMLSKENNAKSIVIMRPPLIGLSRFDLALIPGHDSPPKAENVVVTDGALNLIDDKSLRAASDSLRGKIAPLEKSFVGVLVGGDTRKFKMQRGVIETVIDGVIRACEKHNAGILITTSRRTPGEIEALLRQRLSNQARCKLLVIANDKNSGRTVEAILGLSDVVLVSEESISMVSEAASSRCHTIVFKQQGHNDKRHTGFLKGLHNKGFIDVADSKNIYETVDKALSVNKRQPVLDNSAKVKEALRKIL